jgi:hypothetical protein
MVFGGATLHILWYTKSLYDVSYTQYTKTTPANGTVARRSATTRHAIISLIC